MLSTEWAEYSQQLEFPPQVSNADRIRIRRNILEQESRLDDWEECGIAILPPPDVRGDMSTAILPRRVATAFKAVLGERCGNPSADFIDEFHSWKENRDGLCATGDIE